MRPALEASLDKTVRPGTAVEPGSRVVAGLAARVVGTSEYVSPRTLVVEDVWGGGVGEFWDAFDLTGVAPTQVPTGASLTVEAIGPDGAVYMAALRGTSVWRVPIHADGTAGEPQRKLHGTYGRIRDVLFVGDRLWLTTSNNSNDKLISLPLSDVGAG